MNTKHTPGPWRISNDSALKHGWFIYGNTSIAANMPALARVSTHEADARLIAAAPELLEALKWAVAFLQNNQEGVSDNCQTFINEARAAIAKAQGE